MKKLLLTSICLLLTVGLVKAQTNMAVVPPSGANFFGDTFVVNSTATFNITFQYTGPGTFTGSIGYSIFVDTTGQGNQFVPVHIDSATIPQATLNNGDTVSVLVTHNLITPPYRLGGNTTVIWPIANVDNVDSLSGEIFLIEPNGIPGSINEGLRPRLNPYPNPTRDKVNLIRRGQEVPEEVLLFDGNGRLLQHLRNTGELFIGEFQNGVYYLQVIRGDGRIEHHKLIKHGN